MTDTRHLRRGSSVLLAAGLLVAALPAQAAIHRCVDANGQVHYQDATCPAAGNVQRPAVGDVAAPVRPVPKVTDAPRTAAVPTTPAAEPQRPRPRPTP